MQPVPARVLPLVVRCRGFRGLAPRGSLAAVGSLSD